MRSHALRSLILAAALAATGCGDAPPPPSEKIVDQDGDGFSADHDCDDHDPQRWQQLTYLFRDADQDGHLAADGGQICAGLQLPSGYFDHGNADDCDDHDAKVWLGRTVFSDRDGDRVGAGAPSWYCGAFGPLPAGLSEDGSDCDDGDGNAWQLLAYGYRDVDGDQYTVAESSSLCSGNALPAGYLTSAGNGPDCDDHDAGAHKAWAVYHDGDGDQVGVDPLLQLCAGEAQPPQTALRDGDCDDANAAAWQTLAYAYRDGDGDSYTVPSVGQLCTGASLPKGYGTIANGNDCNDADASVWKSWSLYADQDDDHHGSGSASVSCGTDAQPAHTALVGGDCDDGNAAIWQPLAYSFRDGDGDGYTVAQSGSVCSGAALPAGYATSAGKGSDCNDGDGTVWAGFNAYRDGDGDHVGAGAAVAMCTDGSVPAGYSKQGSDCNDRDATVWQSLAYSYVDRDGDGYTVATSGNVCAGAALPKGYASVANGNDCNDHDSSLYRWMVLYPDADGDGVGAAMPREIDCLGATLPAGKSIYGDDVDDGDKSVWDDEEGDAALMALLSSH